MTSRGVALLLLALFNLTAAAEASTASFLFGRNAFGLTGVGSKTIAQPGVAMSLATTVPGAEFNENGTRGLGSNSRAVAGATDPEIDRFNVLGGALDGQREGLVFSFNTAGVVTDLLFDGLSDEAFEFFRLETPSGRVLSLFDSEVGLRVTRLSAIDEPNVTLLEEIGVPDDDLSGLSIPFAAGETFTLTYGEYLPDPSDLAPGFDLRLGNGGRFEGVVVTLVPEPTGAAIIVGGLVLVGPGRRRRSFGLDQTELA
ncbi:MAG: hypothetical protein AAGG46_00505 [Planctomycetota bacterium]